MAQKLALSFFILMSSLHIQAQTNDSLLTELATKWKNAQAYAVAIAQAMPDTAYNFKPVAEEMSFGQQLLHIAQNINWLSGDFLLQAKTTAYTGPITKDAIIENLQAAYNKATAAHMQLTSAQLNEVVPFFAGPKTRRQMLFLLHDHQSHHLGQLIVYLRLNGIKPPPYVGW